jgi:TrmH RNA methyltransferase
MTDRDRPEDSPYRGPPKQRLDKRARDRQRDAGGGREQGMRSGRPPSRDSAAASRPPTTRPEPPRAPADGPPEEQRFHGLNACLALFRHRPEALRKLWLLESRIPAMKPVLAWCVAHRLGYTIVEADDLERLSGSTHHEGVVFAAMPAPEQNLSDWLRFLPAGPQLVLWLDGVGNPHNLGAMLRSAAHFGAAAILLPREAPNALTGAAVRVAEGGAEALPVVRLGRTDNAIAQLQSAGFTLAATVVRGGESVHATKLPARLALVLGAEQVGVSPGLAQAAALRLSIPGTGAVDSLNVAAATAVLLAEWRRQQA